MSEAVEQPQRSTGRTIFRNTVFGFGSQIALRFLNVLTTVLIVRALGGTAYGQYQIVFAWSVLFGAIGDLGITTYLAREIARDRTKINELFWNSVVLRLCLSVLTMIVTVVCAIALTDYSPIMILGIAIFTTGYLFQSVMAPLNSVFIGNERVDITSILEVVMQALFILLAALVLFLQLDYIWLLIAGTLNLPINLAIQYGLLKRNKINLPRFTINRALWWSLIKAGLPFALIQISLSFAFRFDTIMLSGRVPDEQVGWYSAAYNLVLMFVSVARSFSSAAMPSLAREHATNPQAILPWYYRSVKAILTLVLPMAVGGTLLADHIVIIFFESAYLPAAVALAILVWDLPFVTFDSLCGNLSASIKQEKNSSRIYGSLGIINIFLNLILVPLFGIIGASFATVLTDLTGSAQFYLLFRRELGPGLGFTRLLRVVASAGAMGVLVFLLRDINLFIIIPIAAAFYFTVIWFSGALASEERAYIAAFARRSYYRIALSEKRKIKRGEING